MKITLSQFLAIVGILVLIGGVVALATSVTAYYGADTFTELSANCGVGFSADIDGLNAEARAACRDALGDRRIWAWPVLIVGLLITAAAVALEANNPSRPDRARDSAEQDR